MRFRRLFRRHDVTRGRRLAFALFFVVYGLLLAGVVWGVGLARRQVLSSMTDAQTTAGWERWRARVQEGTSSGRGPVRRVVPKSDQPPAVVLMRDYYGTVLAAATVFFTAFYLIASFLIRGLWLGDSDAAGRKS